MQQSIQEIIKVFTNIILKLICNYVKPQKDLTKSLLKSTQNAPILDPAIGQHLLDNKICTENFDIIWFLISTKAQSFFLSGDA